MNRRNFLKFSGLSAAAFAFGGCGQGNLFAQSNQQKKPNIIFIMVDDMGYGDAGCYGGTNLVPTPNIDRLAAEGVRFTDGYVTAPVCGPCRYGALTGAYQQRFGVQWNHDCWGRLPAESLAKLGIEEETLDNNRIPATQKIINQPLQQAGYITGIAGKWNLPCYPKTTFCESMSVIHFGADYWPNAAGHYNGVNEEVPTSGQKDIIWGPQREGDEYLTDRLGRQSVDFIKANKDNPFFLYLSFNAPHSPMQAKKSHLKDVAHLGTEALKLYGAMMLSTDENIGRVLDVLDELELAENTLVAFLSDNGPTFAYNVDWPQDWPKELLGSAGRLSGRKGQYLEGGIRVPFIMRWHSKIKAGQVYKEPVSALDLYPTFCAAAGAEVPEETILDGVNLLPYLNGQKKGSPHDILFWYSGPSGAARKGDWKLLVYGDNARLFNLREDIAETTDLSQKHPELKAQLFEEYRKFCDSMPPTLYWNPPA